MFLHCFCLFSLLLKNFFSICIFEILMLAKKVLRSGCFDAIVCFPPPRKSCIINRISWVRIDRFCQSMSMSMFCLYLCRLCLFLCLVCFYVYVYVYPDLPELKGGGKHMVTENSGGVKTLLRALPEKQLFIAFDIRDKPAPYWS